MSLVHTGKTEGSDSQSAGSLQNHFGLLRAAFLLISYVNHPFFLECFIVFSFFI